MEKEYTLTIADRYNIIKYAHQLDSTTAVRLNFDAFIEKLELDDEEQKKYKVSVVDGVVQSSDDTYVRKYVASDFPPVIISAIADYVKHLENSASGDRPTMDADYVNGITKWLKLVL